MQYILWILSIQNIFCVCATFSEQILNAICHIHLPLIIAIVSIISVSVDYALPPPQFVSISVDYEHHNLIKITIDIAPRTSKHTNHIHRITYWSHVDDRNSPPGWSSHGIKAQGTIHMASRQITQYKAHVGEAASPPAKICQTHLADSHRWLDDRCNNRVAQASNSLWVLSSERSSSRYHHRRHQLFSF